ncbi:MAG: hypothetical protein MJ177_02115 [Clostridia bacterium]|nr:hypothetical protein [Clostridia bacterium]
MKKRFLRVRDDFSALPLFDKIFDIAVVAVMITVTVLQAALKDDGITTMQLGLNIASSLTLFITHFLFSPKCAPGGLSLKCQKYIDIIVLFGSVGGQFITMNKYYDNYDTATHLVTGSVVCFIAYYLYEYYSNEPPYKNKKLCAMFCFFMSVSVSLLWEIFEFVSDFLTGSTCQGYDLGAGNEKFFYFDWFSFAVKPELPGAMYDTFADVIAGLITAIITTAVISRLMKRKAAHLQNESLKTESELALK